jgi:hypothetical protein
MSAIASHPHVPRDTFRRCLAAFRALDSTLSLYYASHTTDPTLDEILVSASNLLGRRVTLDTVRTILHVYPQCYSLRENTRTDSSAYVIHLPLEVPIPKRAAEFVRHLNQWIEHNASAKAFPLGQPPLPILASVRHAVNKTRLTRLAKEMRNSADKFAFRAKIEAVEQDKSGLTLLERIKLKEKRNKELLKTDNPHARYLQFIHGKLPLIYDIVFQTFTASDAPSSLPLDRFIDLISDSLSYPVSRPEIEDIVRRLEAVLGEHKVYLVTRGDVTVIKVGNLDRASDLARFTDN